jgi:hypothetical protein
MQLLERGVYEAPFNSTSGDRIALAITSKGRAAGWLTFTDEASERAVRRTLWALLDEVDNAPMLRAV